MLDKDKDNRVSQTELHLLTDDVTNFLISLHCGLLSTTNKPKCCYIFDFGSGTDPISLLVSDLISAPLI